MNDSFWRAGQRDATEEEYNQHDIRKYGGDVDNFARWRDALHHADIDEKPGGYQCNAHIIVKTDRFVYAGRWHQRWSIPIILCGRWCCTFRFNIVREVLIESRWAIRPGQGRFKTMKKVDEAPSDYCVVIQCYNIANYSRWYPYSA